MMRRTCDEAHFFNDGGGHLGVTGFSGGLDTKLFSKFCLIFGVFVTMLDETPKN